jgi:hypothetical protein
MIMPVVFPLGCACWSNATERGHGPFLKRHSDVARDKAVTTELDGGNGDPFLHFHNADPAEFLVDGASGLYVRILPTVHLVWIDVFHGTQDVVALVFLVASTFEIDVIAIGKAGLKGCIPTTDDEGVVREFGR